MSAQEMVKQKRIELNLVLSNDGARADELITAHNNWLCALMDQSHDMHARVEATMDPSLKKTMATTLKEWLKIADRAIVSMGEEVDRRVGR